ncbi:hypothetical protein SEUBUCD646_0L01730 [Saccharomyces eubayanus]|uniref:Uncharacterized protein n=1 Tax=Saccharomyces eubayanus TaxID=1080349 RepID=A0ABN8VIX1_SACEU|nr:hypothetical protein SEUBUCD650_0L01710 [Saccharomyces eubayanus]CAI1601655.1 hypothetical protein SEUBUCD646_0L01730 [Saccharomyces eubayanus]
MFSFCSLIYILSQLCVSCSAYVDVTSAYQVFWGLPNNMTNNQICWLVQASYFDIASNNTGKTLRSGRFEPSDEISMIFRDILVELPNIADSYEYSDLDLSTYSGPEPYDPESDYCTDIMDLMMGVYDEEGNYVKPRSEVDSAATNSTVQRRSSDSDIDECVDEPMTSKHAGITKIRELL